MKPYVDLVSRNPVLITIPPFIALTAPFIPLPEKSVCNKYSTVLDVSAVYKLVYFFQEYPTLYVIVGLFVLS